MTHIKNVSKITAPRNQISEQTSVQREKYIWQFNDPPLWKIHTTKKYPLNNTTKLQKLTPD
jgi:hypothetical protein